MTRERMAVKICRLDGTEIWAGIIDDVEIDYDALPTTATFSIPAPLEPVPLDVPFVRLPKEDPDA